MDDIVEVFHTESPFAAQKVLDVILVPEGIDAVIHDRRTTMLPSVASAGGVTITVARQHAERASALIAEAEANGFLDPEEGEPA